MAPAVAPGSVSVTSMCHGASSARRVADTAVSGPANGGVSRAPAGSISTMRP